MRKYFFAKKVEGVETKIIFNMFLVSFILIAFGGFFLLTNLGFLPPQIWPIVWPLLIIMLGIYIAVVARRLHKFLDKIWKFVNIAESKILHHFEK